MSDQYTIGDKLEALEAWLGNIAGGNEPLHTGVTPMETVLLATKEIVEQRSRVMQLRELCKRAIEVAEHGDYRNGNTCEAGTSDEGVYYAFKAIDDITSELNRI